MSFFLSEYTKIDVKSTGASPQTPVGELTELPRPSSSWFQGGRFAAGEERRGGKD